MWTDVVKALGYWHWFFFFFFCFWLFLWMTHRKEKKFDDFGFLNMIECAMVDSNRDRAWIQSECCWLFEIDLDFIRKNSVNFRCSTKRNHALNHELRQSAASIEMMEHWCTAQCKHMNGHHSIRQSCLEIRTYTRI